MFKKYLKQWSTWRGVAVTVAAATGLAPVLGLVGVVDAAFQVATLAAAAAAGVVEIVRDENETNEAG